ncbi:MAG: CHASE domain-containing protein [Synergistaceae bacterium]|nr:CHASE domain-containing protein [Synergistaceae bacterium]
MIINRKRANHKGAFILLFLGSFLVVMTVGALFVNNKQNMERAQMEQLVTVRGAKVNDVICKLLYKTRVLSALVVRNDGRVVDFDRAASTIVDDPSIRNVLLAPGGVVKYVYPLEGNEKVLGLDFFSEGSGNIEAARAKETGTLVLGGPFDLVQGGQAIVGRLPIYVGDEKNDENFWGIASVTLNYPEALNGAELDELRTRGLAFEIWRIIQTMERGRLSPTAITNIIKTRTMWSCR